MTDAVPGRDRAAERDPASLALLTIRLIGRLRSHHVTRLAAFGLSLPEANALLHMQPGEPMPMRRLADLMGFDKSNLTSVMSKLETRGLVSRDTTTTDRRTRAMVLTGAGGQVRRDIDAALTDGSPLLAGLGPRDRDRLVDLLRQLDEPVPPAGR